MLCISERYHEPIRGTFRKNLQMDHVRLKKEFFPCLAVKASNETIGSRGDCTSALGGSKNSTRYAYFSDRKYRLPHRPSVRKLPLLLGKSLPKPKHNRSLKEILNIDHLGCVTSYTHRDKVLVVRDKIVKDRIVN